MHATGLATIGRDVEVRYTAENQAVANVSLAFSYGKKGADGKRPTQWVDASLWGKRAEALAEYLRKGTKVYAVLEEVHIETFTRQDNTTSSKLAARIADLQLAGSLAPAAAPAPAPRAPAPAPRPAVPAPAPAGFDDMGDDCPF